MNVPPSFSSQCSYTIDLQNSCPKRLTCKPCIRLKFKLRRYFRAFKACYFEIFWKYAWVNTYFWVRKSWVSLWWFSWFAVALNLISFESRTSNRQGIPANPPIPLSTHWSHWLALCRVTYALNWIAKYKPPIEKMGQVVGLSNLENLKNFGWVTDLFA